MEFEQLVKSLSDSSKGKVEVGEDGIVHFDAGDDIDVVLIAEEKSHHLMMATEVAALPHENADKLVREAMKANWLFLGTGGATLSIHPDTGLLAVNQMISYENLSSEEFVTHLGRFIETAAQWRALSFEVDHNNIAEETSPYPEEGKDLIFV